jgi:hypothetical protein
VDFGLLA